MDKAFSMELYNAPYWKTLLHYKPSPFHKNKSLVDDPMFFSAKKGKTNPKAELEGTIKAFFSPAPGKDERHAIERFPGRFKWICDQLNLSKEDFVYIEKMARVSPMTKIYSNLEPTMIYYEPGENPVDIVIGKDASYYHPEAAKLEWSDDIQPFGYRGVKHFFEECERVLELERGQI